MSVNKYLPHVLVLPEDDANRQLANGFILQNDLDPRRIQILEPAGGWAEVVKRFNTEHAAKMEEYPSRQMVLLIDFDESEDRLNNVTADIPTQLRDRVFIIGAWNEPETLKQNLNTSLEKIGSNLAQECRDGANNIWSNPHLRHNADELARLRAGVRPYLFQL